MRQDDVGGERDQLRRVFAYVVSIAAAPAVVDTDVLADGPTRLLETLRKRREAGLSFRIVRRKAYQHADAPHLALLRARYERPCCRATHQCDELASPHALLTGGGAHPTTSFLKRALLCTTAELPRQ